MKLKFNRRALYRAVIAATAVAVMPATSQAAAYYYSVQQLTNIHFYGEYSKDTDGDGNGDTDVWVRPASNEEDPRAATFTGKTAATNSGGGNDGDIVTRSFNTHVPPAGIFPIDPDQADTGAPVPAGLNPNVWAQTSIQAGDYSRSDAEMTTNTPVLNVFNVLESGGENANLVAEGDSTSPTIYGSESSNQFTGYVDMDAENLDGGPGYDQTNTGWTGRLKLEFDYNTGMELLTDVFGETAEATYQVTFNLFEDVASGAIPSFPKVATGEFSGSNCDLDGNGVYGEPCGSDLELAISRSNGGDFTFLNNIGSYEQIIDLRSLGQPPSALYYELGLSAVTKGSAFSVPEPASLLLIGSGMLGAAGVTRLRRRKRA